MADQPTLGDVRVYDILIPLTIVMRNDFESYSTNYIFIKIKTEMKRAPTTTLMIGKIGDINI